ncbi:UDP-N-acetylmuramoyl-tripeptide--D-alanyl-D-alanine ligase [Brasilonema octagenarum UFV-E1]|uniref:UDP-N-acetylmuramoyl-tripeptide--D-alanyl-D-alanine ligase n=1 Tax=Brasilonema sennae CENA114 TaxID=415709 RepID=A0A856MH13_9CYAN|nr:UDP-N-acetylmuramoyl-tripeptide--D-alanyl-D-alanine ligase [Brasilonema sennae]QDL10513.1 UDP-N-acetylmuramoyl-tripeptide--D-alanyl-D-alanine ligase [Brasilonema sennae CENA114]QDL16859.1 UDP-N-acetylmuramoyl-tripeptide--D-alanyl-D-alanine ligase [Brasilonema octagenarum UFV-E1]
MPFSATISQLIEVLCAKAANLSEAALANFSSGIETDSRILSRGEVFVALRGEKFDGHDFVPMAIEKGAMAAIVDFEYENSKFPVLQVKDTLEAYQKIGRWWREQFSIPVIGVTGSVGKTTTKELIAATLSTQGTVLKTYGNYNNEIGVPKTLLQLSAEHDFAVIEMAMRGKGQIAELTEIARPTIGVITNVGTAHIELLGSEEAIAQAKCELLAQMPKDGVAILNYDNPLLMETAARVWQGEVLTYGFSGGDIHGNLIDSDTLEVTGMQLPLPLPGRHNASNFLAALAVAKVLGIDWSCLKSGVRVDMPGGRSQRFTLLNDVVILDETYNAAPEAMQAALHLLAETPGKRRIAVLGAMKELGERSHQLHQQVGETVRKLNLDALLVLVDGEDALAIAKSAEGISQMCFTTHADLVASLKTFVQEGDRILFKAAHSVGLDKVVNQFRTEFAKEIL